MTQALLEEISKTSVDRRDTLTPRKRIQKGLANNLSSLGTTMLALTHPLSCLFPDWESWRPLFHFLNPWVYL